MRRKKQTLFFAIILLVLGLGIGYAAITTTLTIEGTTDVDANTWNVYWDNVQVTSGSVTGSQVTTAPVITDQTVVSFRVNLKEPGEFYEFTVDAVNDGTLNAMIDTITRPNNLPEYAKLTFTYNDDRELYSKQYLKAGQTEKIKIRLEYRDDINPSLLPDTDETINLQVGVTYVQADSTAQDRVLFYSHGGFLDDETEITTTQPSGYRFIAFEYGEGTVKKRSLYYRTSVLPDYLVLTYGDAVSENLAKLTAYCTRITGTMNTTTAYTSCDKNGASVFVYNTGVLRILAMEDCKITTEGEVDCFGTGV